MIGAATNYQQSPYRSEIALNGSTLLEEGFNETQKGSITAAEETAGKSDALMKDCINLVQKAKIWERRAFEAVDENSAKLFRHLAKEFDRLAADRFMSSAEECHAKAANKVGYGTAEIIT